MAKEVTSLSQSSLLEATRTRVKFSGHGNALGAAGYISDTDAEVNVDFLSAAGHVQSVNPQQHGFGEIHIGVAWDNIQMEDTGLIGKIFKKVQKIGVDIDIGCFYELADGQRGAIQALGAMNGSYQEPPFVGLSGDERTGDSEGIDEHLVINGAQWPQIKKILIYLYIYEGAPNWAAVRPQVHINVPGERTIVVTLNTHRDDCRVCLVAGLENVRNGIRIHNYTEYYPGQAEMDRAFGIGLKWDEGRK